MYSTSNLTHYQKFLASPPPPPSPPAPEPAHSIQLSITTTDPSYSGEGPPQPQTPFRTQIKTRDPWSTGLCDCLDDVSNCCITCWCPCITFGRVAEVIDKGSTSCGTSGALYTVIACVTGCACLYSCFYRTKMRQQYLLRETPCADCCVHCFCEPCALCQEYRELQNKGFHLPLGWHGNVERQKRGVAMAPVVEGGMNR